MSFYTVQGDTVAIVEPKVTGVDHGIRFRLSGDRVHEHEVAVRIADYRNSHGTRPLID